jgi:hypothetical protein
VGIDEFDEERYVRANPDVAVMVARGLFRSPLDHWQRAGSLEHGAGRRRSGFYEHDLLYDEETYLRQNPDVAGLIRKRVIGTGYEHWMRHGRVEFSRGRREAPFVANVHALRPFRVSLGDSGVLVVGPLGVDPGSLSLHARHGDGAAQPVSPTATAWTEPINLTDARHRETAARLALVRLPALAAEARRPRPLTLSDAGGDVLVSRDAGVQAFYFAGANDANEFLRHAAALARDDEAALSALTAFAIQRLHHAVSPGEPFSALHLESVERRDEGLDAIGWFAPADGVAELAVWCPETAETGAVQRLQRGARPDVTAALGERAGAAGGAFGFRGFLPLPLASARGARRFVFGVRLPGGMVRWFDGETPVAAR